VHYKGVQDRALTREVPQSNFVTVLAWILIVGSGFVTFISLMQAVMLGFFFPTGQLSLGLSQEREKVAR
jgi:hypothetical protein